VQFHQGHESFPNLYEQQQKKSNQPDKAARLAQN
jgi:hypothetical protein